MTPISRRGVLRPVQAAESERTAMGFMATPRGNRQAGLHKHSVTEIHAILKGDIERFAHAGVPHRAGPMDCGHVPPGGTLTLWNPVDAPARAVRREEQGRGLVEQGGAAR